MEIKRVLNNNVAIIESEGQEKIVMGKGICFSKHAGDEIDESKVNKTFISSTPKTFDMYIHLFSEIPYEYIDLSQEIINYAKTTLGNKLDEKINIDLTDHMYGSIKRFKDGITVKNALLWDIEKFYPYEFEVSEYALKKIKEKFDVALPKDEAGFIALHFVNAELSEGNIENIYDITKVMQEVMNIIKYSFHREFNTESVYYYRFMTHLRFFAQRLIKKKTFDDTGDQDLYDLIKLKYKEASACTEKIAVYCKKTYNYDLSSEEQMYLTIHIERLITKGQIFDV